MRVILTFLENEIPLLGITPAHAGNTYNKAKEQMLSRDHPRACG